MNPKELKKEQLFLEIFKNYYIKLFYDNQEHELCVMIYGIPYEELLIEYNQKTKKAYVSYDRLVAIVESLPPMDNFGFGSDTTFVNKMIKKYLKLDIKYSTTDIFFNI